MSAAEPASVTRSSPSLHVVATAGHVDHGKSALILRLTGMDPDRLAEEKRRGLTIDLGFAWTTLESGHEVGFVDVPGHERFVRNMLAGVGPVRLVLFVVAADEGWKPQSEEHLQILDVLGVDGAVVALTKVDQVDSETRNNRTAEVTAKLEGTALAGAPIVGCSAVTGEGMADVRAALDATIGSATPAEALGRARQFIDRVFTVKGSGTVVTGTLTGGALHAGDEAEVLPSGHRARIRGLQTHKRPLTIARPVSRVAVNLAGTPKENLERGDVLTVPGQWRATSVIEGSMRTVRGLGHALSARGAFKLYAGSAERDARIRLYGPRELRAGEEAFVRVTLSRPLVLDFKDSFVLREAGRQETVAGGVVLDTEPPLRSTGDPIARLQARQDADRAGLAWRVVVDRGALRASEMKFLAGVGPGDAESRGAARVGAWLMTPELLELASETVIGAVSDLHERHPLQRGMEVPQVHSLLTGVSRAFADPGLSEALLEHLVGAGGVQREENIVRLPDHGALTAGREDADRLVSRIEAAEPMPPSVKELASEGFDRELIQAACTDGRLVRVSPDVVVTPHFLARAEEVVRERSADGVTVSAFREALGTTRKYALPILEYFDERRITRRKGDVRVLKE
ncbi:MAG TPA: selenocysteine-specific translation elongation factor [Actinomycetota bacterium]